jgi:hypothetical protein
VISSLPLEVVASLLLLEELDSVDEELSSLLDDGEVDSTDEDDSSLLDDGDELDSDAGEATEEGASELEVGTVELSSIDDKEDDDVGSVRDTLRRVLELELETELKLELELDLEVEVVSSSRDALVEVGTTDEVVFSSDELEADDGLFNEMELEVVLSSEDVRGALESDSLLREMEEELLLVEVGALEVGAELEAL